MSNIKLALVIVDLQEDFLPPSGSLAVKDGRTIIPSIIKLLHDHQWSAIITTKDWHPKDHTSFASNHEGKALYSEIEFTHPLNELDPKTSLPLTKNQILWPDHCIQQTPGAEFAKEFIPEYETLTTENKIPTFLVKKGYLSDREYYSCFQDVWGVHKTEMSSLLSDNGITDVFFVGLAYDFCVLNSAIDSSRLGYKSYVIKDCTKSVYPDKELETDSVYISNSVQIIHQSDPILNF